MVIERTSFLVALGSLALGGVGGYLAGERGLLPPPRAVGVTERQPAAPVAASEPTTPRASPPASAGPVCDDSVGAAGACPAPGYPSEEGGCGALPAKRCEDFKKTMKPRVAERAVACLDALSPGQRCDANRIEQCAQVALLSACPEPEAVGVAGAAPADDLDTRCTRIAQSCSGSAFAPTVRECRETMAGLNPFGREQVSACMATHCGDKGLAGCEASIVSGP